MGKKCIGEDLCLGMSKYLNKKQSGFITQSTINTITGEFGTTPIFYRLNTSDRGLVLNYCPWCGERLFEQREEGAES